MLKRAPGIIVLAALLGIDAVAAVRYASGVIDPGAVWLDNRGKEIQGHGGGILRRGDTFYWFGEDRSPVNDPDKRYVAPAAITQRIPVYASRLCSIELGQPSGDAKRYKDEGYKAMKLHFGWGH